MSNLFGLNIKSIISGAVKGGLRPIYLTRTVEGAYDPITDQTTTTTETYTTEGIEENRTKFYESGLISSTEVPILLIADPLGTDPKKGDEVSIDGNEYTITGILERDPASATWTVKAEA